MATKIIKTIDGKEVEIYGNHRWIEVEYTNNNESRPYIRIGTKQIFLDEFMRIDENNRFHGLGYHAYNSDSLIQYNDKSEKARIYTYIG